MAALGVPQPAGHRSKAPCAQHRSRGI